MMDLSLIEKRLLLLSKGTEGRLLSKPLSLLCEHKLSCIYKILERNQIKNFLEIGTWVGGSVYALSKYSPETKFDTVDINDFEQMYESNKFLVCVLETELSRKLKWQDLKKIQNFYRKNSPGVNFYDVKNFDWKNKVYDAILIDGDHSQTAVKLDLENAYDNMSYGFIFVDDTSYFHIRRIVETFCNTKKLKLKYFETVPLKDFAVIKIDKNNEKPKIKPKFPTHIRRLQKRIKRK